MKIKIGPYKYDMQPAQHLCKSVNHSGEILTTSQKINIPVEGPDIAKQYINASIMHECIHGVLDVIGEQELCRNEDFVERFSMCLLSFIQDNPRLIEKLNE